MLIDGEYFEECLVLRTFNMFYLLQHLHHILAQLFFCLLLSSLQPQTVILQNYTNHDDWFHCASLVVTG